MKRSAAAIIVIILIAVGAYAIFHKSPTKTPSSSTSGNQSPISSGAIIQTKTASGVGSYLADANGNALYTYGADSSGVSNCSDSCLYTWPIYQATKTTSLPTNVTVITRSDGSMQYVYKGMPLYTFTSDSSGRVTGDNVSNFHIAKP